MGPSDSGVYLQEPEPDRGSLELNQPAPPRLAERGAPVAYLESGGPVSLWAPRNVNQPVTGTGQPAAHGDTPLRTQLRRQLR